MVDSHRDQMVKMFTRQSTGSSHPSSAPSSARPEMSKPDVKFRSSARKNSHFALDSVAEAVLKSTRRELGSQFGGESERPISEADIASAIDRVCDSSDTVLDHVMRSNIIVHLKSDLFGWGVLQPLIDDPDITDIHCYDYRTVVLQRGKDSETTGLRWPSPESYQTYIDRILLRLGKSISTQQHTVDGAFADGKRVCAIHQSVCGSRGPLLTIRVPRLREISLETLIEYGVCPPLIANYLGALVGTCAHTLIVAGETGTGKTTMLRCLGSRFRDSESIIAVEDTPELNYQHPYYRSLISRYANTEGVGEVSLQEHIKSTLRLCPTRVILGEMRTPEAAEAFLEAAQTGHAGLSTIHARNARETLTRLESLLGRAQRGVSTDIIRQQIGLALDVICWCIREKESGKIRLAEVIEIGNYLEGQIQVRPMFNLVRGGDNPAWEVLSFASSYDEELREQQVFLSQSPRYIELPQESPAVAANQ